MLFQQELAAMRHSFKAAIEWRASMVLSVITGPLFFLVNYFIWTAVFAASGKTVISGYTLNEMIIYLAITQASFYFMWNDAGQRIANRVRKGSLAKYLLRPMSYMRFEYFDMIGHRALATLIEVIPVVTVLVLFLGIESFKTSHPVQFVFALIIGLTINFQINALLGTISFWVVEPQGFMRIYNTLLVFLSGAIIPLSLFPSWFQSFSFYLPFQFIRFVPASVFLGSYELAGKVYEPTSALLLGLAQIIVLALLIKIFWAISIRKYSGVGQ